jgi:CBS domain containing-hemolysin-like protein
MSTIEFTIIFFIFLWSVSTWGALLSLSLGRIRKVEETNRKFANSLEKWLDRKQEYEIILRFIILFAAGVITVYSFVFYKKIFDESSPYLIALLSSGSTFLLLLATEIFTGSFVYIFDLTIMKISMPIMEILRKSLFFPLVATIMGIRRKIDHLQNASNGGNDKRASTEDEILSLIENDDTPTPNVGNTEKNMIKAIFKLDKTLVREIMTPRVDILGIPSNTSLDDAKRKIIETGHSRIPIYEHNIDRIKGVLYAKDMLNMSMSMDKNLLDISRHPLLIPENKTAMELLGEFKKKSAHFAVVVDEYGGTAGILTLEDIIEQIVGEIGDEYDSQEDILPNQTELPDGSVIFDARALVSEVNTLFDNQIEEEDGIDTIGGYICAKLGRIPETGEKFTLNNSLHIIILKSDRRKIIKLKMSSKK